MSGGGLPDTPTGGPPPLSKEDHLKLAGDTGSVTSNEVSSGSGGGKRWRKEGDDVTVAVADVAAAVATINDDDVDSSRSKYICTVIVEAG